MQTRNRQPAFVLLPLVLAVSAASHTQAQEDAGRTDWTHDIGVTVGNEYHDNILHEHENCVSDTITTVSRLATLSAMCNAIGLSPPGGTVSRRPFR